MHSEAAERAHANRKRPQQSRDSRRRVGSQIGRPMKPPLCKICAITNRQRVATGQAISKTMATYARPTPVCDKCGAIHEGKGGKVKWGTKQKKLITE